MKDVMKKVVVVLLTRIALPPGKNYRWELGDLIVSTSYKCLRPGRPILTFSTCLGLFRCLFKFSS